MKYLIYLLPILILTIGACDQKKAQEETATQVIYILSEQGDCLDQGKLQCVKYKKSEDSDSVYTYDDNIKGLTYLDGFNYVVKVKNEMVENEESGKKEEKWVLAETIKKEYDEEAYMTPEEITAKYYKNARIKVDESTQNLPKLVPGSSLVFRFKRRASQNERVADDELNEKVLVEVKPQSGNFTINGEKEAIKAFYGKYCFCEHSGLASMEDFTLNVTEVKDSYKVEITIPAQEMKMMGPGKGDEKVPLVRENKTFTATFHRGSVWKILEDDASTMNNLSRKLMGKWTLTTINDKSINEYSMIAKTPTLDFRIKENMYHGNDGCNIIKGAFAIDKIDIAFDQGISTKMACKGELDEDFQAAFKKVNNWRVRNDKLYLRNYSENLLVFERK